MGTLFLVCERHGRIGLCRWWRCFDHTPVAKSARECCIAPWQFSHYYEVASVESSNVVGAISVVVQLIFLEGILSIDNAAVLGAMVSVLPDNKPVPFPRGV